MASLPSCGRRRDRTVIRRPLLALILALCVAALQTPAAAQTWTGNKSNDWTDPGNWSGGVVPTNGGVAINTTSPNPTVVGVSGAAAATSATIFVGEVAAASGALTIQNGSTLTSNATAFSYMGSNGGTGIVNVTGAGSKWTINGVPAGVSLVIGETNTASSGTLNISNGGAVSTAGDFAGSNVTLNVTSGGTLTTGRDAYIATVTGANGTATISGPGSLWTIAVRLFVCNGGTGTLNIVNGATVTAGNTFVANPGGSGTLNISGGGILKTQSLARGGSAQVNFDGGTLQARANNASFINSFSGTQLNIKAGGLALDTAGFAVGTGSTSGFSGVGGLSLIGGGTFTLSAVNTYSGATSIASGTALALSGAGSIAGSSKVIADGTFNISGVSAGSTSVKSLAGTGDVALGSKTLTITNANDTFAGVIGGGGGLTIAGGTQVLTGTNTYLGTTTRTRNCAPARLPFRSWSIAPHVVHVPTPERLRF